MIASYLLLLSSAALGIFVGAQIAEAILFVPLWKNVSAEEFFQFHETYGKKLYQFFAPLTILATFSSLLAVGYGLLYQSDEKLLLTIMGISTLLFFSTYYLYFKKANNSFATRSLSNQELEKELVTWGNWHWGRIVFECIAFVCSLMLLMKI